MACMLVAVIQGELKRHKIIEKAALGLTEFLIQNDPQPNIDVVQQLEQAAVACLIKACSDELNTMPQDAKGQKS